MKIAFWSTMHGLSWGGSEVLWGAAAAELLKRGHQVAVNFEWWARLAAPLQRLKDQGASIMLRNPPVSRRRLWEDRARRVLKQPARNMAREWLDAEKPDLVVITLAWHLDEPPVLKLCVERRIPYVLNVQVASSANWLDSSRLETFRQVFLGARTCCFLSQENLDIMETQLARRLPNAVIVDNPLGVSVTEPLPFPPAEPDWRVAVVGRFHFSSKGQDLVLAALADARWRTRNIKVNFWGDDHGQGQLLRDLVLVHHGLQKQAEVCGYSNDARALWRDHHALLLTSRFEGLPMITLEAMLCGRVPIVTRYGRNVDAVDDGETGFLVAAPTVTATQEALERAWSRRTEWEAMGRLGAQRVAASYGANPTGAFVELVEAAR